MSKNIFKIPITIIILILISFFIFQFNTSKNTFCANQISCIKDLTGNYDSQKSQGQFQNKIVSIPTFISNTFSDMKVLANTTGEKRIEVNLTNQHLYAFEGDTLVYDFPVSTGKWGKTPTGTFDIWIKLRYTKMEGGNKEAGTYYYLPNVPYTMFFHNGEIPKYRGFGIHGAYWHNNFGHPMSHGCINMRTEDVEKIYYWADPPSVKNTTYASEDNPGTKIIIYGKAPNV